MKFVVLILSVLFLFPFCSSKRVKPSIDTNVSLEELPSQESWNSVITFSDSGKISAILYAGHLKNMMKNEKHFLIKKLK